jgi:hypothetical protein
VGSIELGNRKVLKESLEVAIRRYPLNAKCLMCRRGDELQAVDFQLLEQPTALILTRIDSIGSLKPTKTLAFGSSEYRLVSLVPTNRLGTLYCRRGHSWYMF